jgi:hypothetical protein
MRAYPGKNRITISSEHRADGADRATLTVIPAGAGMTLDKSRSISPFRQAL